MYTEKEAETHRKVREDPESSFCNISIFYIYVEVHVKILEQKLLKYVEVHLSFNYFLV